MQGSWGGKRGEDWGSRKKGSRIVGEQRRKGED